MSRFDTIRQGMTDRVKSLYGDEATWSPSGGGATQTCLVLLNLPTAAYDIQDMGGGDGWVYSPLAAWFEYVVGDLDGLEASARAGGNEVVTIGGIDYLVTSVKRPWDGNTLRAKIEIDS